MQFRSLRETPPLAVTANREGGSTRRVEDGPDQFPGGFGRRLWENRSYFVVCHAEGNICVAQKRLDQPRNGSFRCVTSVRVE